MEHAKVEATSKLAMLMENSTDPRVGLSQRPPWTGKGSEHSVNNKSSIPIPQDVCYIQVQNFKIAQCVAYLHILSLAAPNQS